MLLKTCNLCKEVKVLEDFHRNSKSPDGRRSDCKECRKEETQKRLTQHRDRLNAEKREWYKDSKKRRKERNQVAIEAGSNKCTGCDTIKSYKEFYFRTNGGLQNVCKDCWKVKTDIYAEANAGKVREWRRIREQRRRARIQSLPYDFDSDDWEDCLIHFEHSCAYCGDSATKMTQDHVVAVSKGGGYTVDNIIPACFSCNTKKHNSDMKSWYLEQDFFIWERMHKIESYLSADKP